MYINAGPHSEYCLPLFYYSNNNYVLTVVVPKYLNDVVMCFKENYGIIIVYSYNILTVTVVTMEF